MAGRGDGGCHIVRPALQGDHGRAGLPRDDGCHAIRRWQAGRRTGSGGSIPLCDVLAATFLRAEVTLIGVEEPLASIHAPNESVDPGEIADLALTEAVFLRRYAAAGR